MHYFDASALVKRYVREAGSARVRRLLAPGTAVTSRYTAVEVASALARRVREGAVSPDDATRALAALDSDMRSMLVVELTTDVVVVTQSLLQRHALRAGDVVQLASCLFLRDALGEDLTFVAFDARLNAAARQERLRLPRAR